MMTEVIDNRRTYLLIVLIIVVVLSILSCGGLSHFTIFRDHSPVNQPSTLSKIVPPPGYRVIEEGGMLLLLVPATTSEEEDIAAVSAMGRELLKQNRSIMSVCVESEAVPGAYRCFQFVFVRDTQ